MILFHVTPTVNRRSIRKLGLQLSRRKGRIAGVWLCTESMIPWALEHISRHQGTVPDRMAVLAVSVSRGKLRRFRRGIWIHLADVPPGSIFDISGED